MKKDQILSSDTSIPDSLNVLVRKIGLRDHVQEDKSKMTAKELLTTLTPAHIQLGCLPVITSLERCNGKNDKIKKISDDYYDSDKKADETLRKAFNEAEEKVKEESDTECSTSVTDELEMSFDGKWLRKFFKLPLKMAIKDIVSKKPYDPVGYLGFWLLNYRKCQERRRWQLEKDNELNYLRSLVEEPISKEEEVSVTSGEEEEEMRDWNFKYYESMSMAK